MFAATSNAQWNKELIVMGLLMGVGPATGLVAAIHLSTSNKTVTQLLRPCHYHAVYHITPSNVGHVCNVITVHLST